MNPLKESSFNQEVENYFHTVEGSLKNIEQARIVFLGNRHYQPEHAWKISWLIERMYQEGDVVLVESPLNKIQFCDKTQFVTKQLNMQGWDSKLREREHFYKECLVNTLLLIDHVRRDGLKEGWIEKTHRLIRLSPPSQERQDQLIFDTYSAEKLEELESLEQRLSLFNAIVVDITKDWVSYLSTEVVDTFFERNSSMIQTIQRHSSCSSRIFVIAGIAHLTLDPHFTETDKNDEITESVKLVSTFCADKEYVILYPNGDKTHLNTIKRQLRPTKCVQFNNFFKKIDGYITASLYFAALLLSPSSTTTTLVAACSKAMEYCKGIPIFSNQDRYRESLQQIPLLKLTILLYAISADETMLPRKVGIAPLKAMQKEGALRIA